MSSKQVMKNAHMFIICACNVPDFPKWFKGQKNNNLQEMFLFGVFNKATFYCKETRKSSGWSSPFLVKKSIAVSWKRGTPSYHPFYRWIFHEINHPASLGFSHLKNPTIYYPYATDGAGIWIPTFAPFLSPSHVGKYTSTMGCIWVICRNM